MDKNNAVIRKLYRTGPGKTRFQVSIPATFAEALNSDYVSLVLDETNKTILIEPLPSREV